MRDKTSGILLKHEEKPNTDLRLSDLRRWQRALAVPLIELLVDDDRPLSAAVMERAKLLRVMKTVLAIHEQSSSAAVCRMAESMIAELRQVMPELVDVAPWHRGERLKLHDYGCVTEHPMPDSFFTSQQCRGE